MQGLKEVLAEALSEAQQHLEFFGCDQTSALERGHRMLQFEAPDFLLADQVFDDYIPTGGLHSAFISREHDCG